MATPEAAQRLLDREMRALDYIAREYGTEEEVRQYQETVSQPTYGDPMFEQIFLARGLRELLQHITKIEVPEEVIMSDEKIYEYDPNQEKDADPSEEQEWKPSHLDPAVTAGQGPISEEVHEAMVAGDREGQEADETSDLTAEEQNRAETDISTNDEENEEEDSE